MDKRSQKEDVRGGLDREQGDRWETKQASYLIFFSSPLGQWNSLTGVASCSNLTALPVGRREDGHAMDTPRTCPSPSLANSCLLPPRQSLGGRRDPFLSPHNFAQPRNWVGCFVFSKKKINNNWVTLQISPPFRNPEEVKSRFFMTSSKQCNQNEVISPTALLLCI